MLLLRLLVATINAFLEKSHNGLSIRRHSKYLFLVHLGKPLEKLPRGSTENICCMERSVFSRTLLFSVRRRTIMLALARAYCVSTLGRKIPLKTRFACQKKCEWHKFQIHRRVTNTTKTRRHILVTNGARRQSSHNFLFAPSWFIFISIFLLSESFWQFPHRIDSDLASKFRTYPRLFVGLMCSPSEEVAEFCPNMKKYRKLQGNAI